MTEQQPTLAQQLHAALLAAGWKPGVPPSARRAWPIDKDIARELECPACTRLGLEARPYRKGNHYSVLVVCRCGYAEEF